VSRSPGSTLTVDELEAIAKVALAEGVTSIKLTGGEPLLYRSGAYDVVSLTARLAGLRDPAGSPEISMTTNGTLIGEYANNLRAAGLDRVTLSITTLDTDTFGSLISAGKHLLARSLDGLRAARGAGLEPVKVNMVVYHSTHAGMGNLRELGDVVRLAASTGVAELRLFTLLWHRGFHRFGEFYQFFSDPLRVQLEHTLEECGVDRPGETVEILAHLATEFAGHSYPKVEFGVDLGALKLGFEAMKYGRYPGHDGMQEGPYAMRVGSDGALRPTLDGRPLYDLIGGVRDGMDEAGLRRIYRAALEEMP
jgi:hypothetical protein